MKTIAHVSLAGALCCLLSCASGGATPAPQTASQSPASGGAATPPPDRAAHMQASFWRAIDARDALIAGKLERAKKFASELAHQDDSKILPADWKHWVEGMRQRADELVLAPDLEAASQAIGRLALACGECHAWKRQGRQQQPPEDPNAQYKPEESMPERMYRHELAADELWLGLIDASETMWARGTVTITRAPLEPPTDHGQPVDEPMASEIEQIRTLGKTARSATTHEERAQIYGDIVSHCAACHSKSAR